MHNFLKISFISSLVIVPLESRSYNRKAHLSFSSTLKKKILEKFGRKTSRILVKGINASAGTAEIFFYEL